MKTLVCLISAQHIPNLLAVQTLKPDRLVLLVTSGMRGKDNNLLQALNVGGLDYRSRCEIVEIEEENSVQKVYKKLEQAYQLSTAGGEWIVNLTGGTKPMSIGAYTFSKAMNLQTFYLAERKQDEGIDLLGGPATRVSYKVTTAEFLAGYGFALRNAHALAKNREQARQWMDIAAFLTVHHTDPAMRGFLGKLQQLKDDKINSSRNKWEKEGLILTPFDEVSLNNRQLQDRITKQFGLKPEGAYLAGHLDKHTVELLTGKWLEVFVLGLLSLFENDTIWDLHMGVTAGGSGPGEANEFDVSYMKNQSLCIVECKTGGQRHDPSADNVLYKIEAIKAGLKATRVETFLATTSPNVLDRETGGVKLSLKNRCTLYDCKIVPGSDLQKMAQMVLNGDTTLSGSVADAFKLK